MTTVTETRRRYSAELEGDWAVFAKIAGFFVYKVPPDDREDFLQDMLLEMVKVKAKYDAKGKTLTEASLMMVASYELKDYWDKRRHRLFGLNCSNCTSEQRRECRTRLPSECPKGKSRQVLRMTKIIRDGDGNKPTELLELIADNKSIDLAARLDARRILQLLPKGLVKIGYKRYAGWPLKKEEKEYLKHWQKVHPPPFNWRRDHLDERILELFRNTRLLVYVRKRFLDELILELLRKNPQGLTRADLSMRLQVLVGELNLYLNRLVKRQQVISVKRESTRGRPPTPLLFIAGATIPEEKNVATERDERIRQVYFVDGWSIKRINREFHHDKRTIHRAIYGIKIKRR
ncbi:hypothetical protein ES703_89578 [subsurface metagenome]